MMPKTKSERGKERGMRPPLIVLSLGALSLSACSAILGSDASDGGGDGALGADGGMTDEEAIKASPFGDDLTVMICDEGETPPLPSARIWRLSREQYAGTVGQRFGGNVDPTDLPADGIQKTTGLDNDAAAAFVTDQWAQIYFDQAKELAAELVANLEAAGGCIVQAAPATTCVADFVRNHGSSAFRRPVTEEEVKRYGDFHAASLGEYGVKAAAEMVLEAILQSPNLVYRTELGEEQSKSTALTQHELAQALSYWLTDLPPDAQLQAAAEAGELSAETLGQHARRLVESDAGRQVFQRFFYLYLHLNDLENGANPIEPALAAELIDETLTFVDYTAFEAGGGIEEIFTANITFPSSHGAELYGLASVDPSGPIELDPTSRGGVYTQLALLNAKHGPVHRGLIVREDLLCQELPVPPAGAQTMAELLKAGDPDATEREHYERLVETQPSCAGCHGLFVPLGLAFDSYDDVGRYRTENEAGRAIDPTGELTFAGDAEGPFENAPELVARIAQSDVGQACFAKRFLSFAQGRDVIAQEEICTIERLRDGMQAEGLSPAALAAALASDETFMFRTWEQLSK